MRVDPQRLLDDIREELDTEAVDDIDFKKFDFSSLTRDSAETVTSFEAVDETAVESLSAVGVNWQDNSQSGKFLLYGHAGFTQVPKIDGVEILPIGEALQRYPEIREQYFFQAVKADQDALTRAVAETVPRGVFIRVKQGVIVNEPLQAGFFMDREMGSMSPHNLVVLEEGARLHLLTGCTAACELQGGLHVAISEHFVGKDAQLINTMIHHWGPEFIVRPRGATIVEEGGSYVSNYYSVQPARALETNPLIHLKGDRSTAKNMNVLVCMPGTYSNIGGTVLMTGENSGAEIVARTINHGGTIVQTGLLIGAAKDARAHVDCSGLMLSESGTIEAIPGLRSMHPEARMSHEAAIGRIDMGEVYYLQSKGLTEMQAIALIVRGFLDIGVELENLAPEIKRAIQNIAELSGHGEA